MRKPTLRRKNSIRPLVLVAFAGLLTTATPASAQTPATASATPAAVSTCHPTRLRCEYLTDPLGIDVTQPRLDWILTGSRTTPRHLLQTGYQILVASSPELLARDQGDLWDSGQVTSDATSQIAYAGRSLDSRARCYWKVRSWDSTGKVTPWSTPASWEMGLLHPYDWSATWIAGPLPADPAHEYQPPPILRSDFPLSASPVVRARLYVTALGLYEMHLNGRRVGDHLLAPDWTDYSKRVRYQVYDVTALVAPGANTLAGLLGNGWYCGHIGNGGFQAWGKAPALFAQLEVAHADGTVERVVTDGQWKTHASPIVASDFMLGESYDARQEITSWDRPGLDTRVWSAATVRDEPARALDGQADQPVRETAELKPRSLTEPKPGHYTFDLGQNMVGVVRLRVTAPAGTTITLRHGEMLNGDGTLYTQNLRGAPSVDTYTCKGGGEETWQPRFTFHGFRYVELTGLPRRPAPDAVRGIVIGTDFPPTGEFSCSDPRVNQLQSNIQWGMRGNYLSVPTDCPQRDERMGWMGDAEIFIRTATYNGDVAAFFTKWLVDVDDAQRDGQFTDISPSPQGHAHGGSGTPAWGDAGVICPWTIYLMYGDTRILRQHLPAMTRWVEWCRAHSTGLIRDHDRGSDYGDWLSQGEGGQNELIGTAYFAYVTSLVARSYDAIGDSANAAKYAQLADAIRQAFEQRYVQPDGHIASDTQAAYAMALRFDLLPPDLRRRAAAYLADNIARHQNHLTTGFVGVSYLLPALTSENRVNDAYHLFLQDTFPSWLFSVKHGATTVWERWDGWTPENGFQNPGMNSFNHYSLGSCGEWMFDTVAGIGVDPAQPGFRHILLRPQPGPGLTEARGTFDSIQGRIATQWKVSGGRFSLHVTVPVNTTATLGLPTADPASVREGGQRIAAHPEIEVQPVQGGPPQYEIGSGDYDFTCALP
ncbi:MAG: glycoside hydrolase family 78 protein [Verrucomicrobiota bacterium]